MLRINYCKCCVIAHTLQRVSKYCVSSPHSAKARQTASQQRIRQPRLTDAATLAPKMSVTLYYRRGRYARSPRAIAISRYRSTILLTAAMRSPCTAKIHRHAQSGAGSPCSAASHGFEIRQSPTPKRQSSPVPVGAMQRPSWRCHNCLGKAGCNLVARWQSPTSKVVEKPPCRPKNTEIPVSNQSCSTIASTSRLHTGSARRW